MLTALYADVYVPADECIARLNTSHYHYRADKTTPKKVLHPATLVVKGRTDSINSSDNIELGIRSEKPTIHERTTPTKTKPLINRNDNVRGSGEGPLLSLPELSNGAHDSKLI